MFGRKREIENLRSQVSALNAKLEAVGKEPAVPSLADQLVKSMGELLAASAAQQPALMGVMTDFLGKTLDQVRRDTARQMGREGGKRSAAGRAKRKADTQALERLQAMSGTCRECYYQLHGVPFADRGVHQDYDRHKEDGHDAAIAQLIGPAGQAQLAPPGETIQ